MLPDFFVSFNIGNISLKLHLYLLLEHITVPKFTTILFMLMLSNFKEFTCVINSFCKSAFPSNSSKVKSFRFVRYSEFSNK